MAHATFDGFDRAIELADGLEKESNSSVFPTDQIQILKVELRFLNMFLKYTARRCTDYKNLQNLLTRIQRVGRHINKIPGLAPSPGEQQSGCRFYRAYQLLFKRAAKKDNIGVKSDEFSGVDDAIRNVLCKIKLVRPEISEVQNRVLTSSSKSSSGTDVKLVKEFVDSLMEGLRELLGCEADLLEPSLKQGIQILERKLRFLRCLFGLTATRCKDRDILNQLVAHVQAVADRSAYLAYSCLIDERDEYMTRRLAFELSVLADEIHPGTREARELYVGVMEAPSSSKSELDTCETDETVLHFVDSLLEKTSGLPYQGIMPIQDKIEILQEELRSFRYFLGDAKRFHKPGISKDLLALVEAMAIDAGSVIYSLLEGQVDQEIGMGKDEMSLALSELLDRFNLVDVRVRKPYVDFQNAQLNFPNFPRTDELGALDLDLFLRCLKELLNAGVHSITLLKDEILIVQRDLEFLGSFLTTIRKQRHEHEKLEDLWNRIIHVVYKVEYVIDLAVVECGPVLHHKVWLSNFIEEIKLIKEEISKIQIPDKNMCKLEKQGATKMSTSSEFSQMNAPRIDEEMVGFKDEEKKVVEQLVCGPMQLQIVSIVGMPGLGKTFLAQKICNNPIIKDHFYVRAWCKVSQVHERKELLINILQQVTKPTEEMSKKTNEEVAGQLYRSLKGQKYLIVLDDIWDIEAWNDLKRSFPNDNKGSRILFTSRFSNLALQAKPDSKLHHLRSFSPCESWELLQKKIFQTESCPLELVEVGKQIAESCKGLPLLVVVVAGLLARTRNEREQWRKVADNLNSYIIGDPRRQCMDILDLSYKSLPDYLKPCFLYLGAFPEDKEIPIVKLKRLWIAEGFVWIKKPNLECIAEGYLMDLIGRSLVIASKERSTGGVKTCILHDLVREFCLAKAKEENFLKLIEGCGDSPTSMNSSESNIPSSSTSYEQRRVFVHYREHKKFWSRSSGPCVHSLLFFAPRRMFIDVSSVIKLFRLLRVLDLMFVDLQSIFPEGIVLLAQLRYLAVSGDFRSLPPLITNLWNLETFIVGGVLGEISSNTILSMSKLRHLHVSSYEFSDVVRFDDSSRLDSLQTLSTPSLSYGDVETLRRFPNLKKLSCEFRGSWYSVCNQLTMLDFLSKLESLKVSYFGPRGDPCEFSLPSSLKKLTMSRFRLPWTQISIVGKLPNLEVLRLHFNAFEGEEWIMQDGEFPKLKFLKLHYLNIKKWIAFSTYFPPLERLILDRCFRLEEIPSQLEDIPTLKMIQVAYCGGSLETSIKRIQEEQGDMGNEELEVEMRQWDK